MRGSALSNSSKRALRLLLPVVGALAVTPAAAEGVMDTLQMQGFVSQGYVVTNRNNFFGPSSDSGGSLEYTEVGVNASLRPRSDVLIAAQVLSRRAGGDGSDAKPKLDHGVVDYQLPTSPHRTIGIQAGRFKNPFGFYNQTRDVAFTRPSILLPQSIYFDRTRSIALAADGLSVYGAERMGRGELHVQAGAGWPQVDDDVEEALGLDQAPGSLKAKPSAIGQVRYEHNGGRIIAALSAANVRLRYDSRTGGPGNGEIKFQPLIFSLQYNAEKWSLTGEYALRRFKSERFDVPMLNRDDTGESGYIQYSRRILSDWQWFVRYDVLHADRSDRSGRAFEDETGLPAHTRFAKDLTVGLQWSFHPQVLLAAEYHRVDGTGWLPRRDNPDVADTERRWNMLLLQTSLRF